MHEWTDGCSAQYKSRHCMGDVSFSETHFSFPTIRNYFETSHAKGPQDSAGANLKSKADMAVIQRQHIIQNASDLYNFANDNLQLPLAGASLSRRVFFYVENSDRNRPHRQFKEIKGNRAIHSILACGQGRHLEIRDLSCYCEQCLIGDYDQCVNTAHVNAWQEHVLELEAPERRATRADVSEVREGIVDLMTKDSTVAIASGDASADSRFKIAAGCRRQPALWSHLPAIFHGSNRILHLLIGEINVTGTCHSKYFTSQEVMQP